MSITLGVLYLYYPDTDKYQKEKPMAALKKIIARLSCQAHIIYINNAASKDYVQQISDHEYEISGDNSSFEFSGWQKGLDFIKDKGLCCDAFLFANDMFLHDSLVDRWRINDDALKGAIKYKAMVGKKAHLPVEGDIAGNEIMPYIRTHLFFVSATLMAALGNIISVDRFLKDRLFIPSYEASVPLFRPEAPLSSDLKDFIFHHVTSNWNRKKPYTRPHFDLLKGKAVSILNACLLSIRAKQLGYPLISLSKAPKLLSRSLSLDEIDGLWYRGHHSHRPKIQASQERFWFSNSRIYRQLPKSKNFLKKFFSPNHL